MSATGRTIKAIETHYAGCRFRSRLEARWAVFFDALELRWEYEAEGYELPDGTRYLPDFLLPELGIFIEIKGTSPTREEVERAEAIGYEVRALVLFHGPPGAHPGTLYCVDSSGHGGGVGDWPVDWSLDGFGRPLLATETYGHVLLQPDYSDELRVSDWSETLCSRGGAPQINRAISAACSARFEFGETPARPRHRGPVPDDNEPIEWDEPTSAIAPAPDGPESGAERVVRAWQLVLQQAEAQSVALFAVIRDAHVRADGECLAGALPSSLALGKASTPDSRELLLAIIARTTGDAPDLRFELEDAS
jgi:hypothetical protein